MSAKTHVHFQSQESPENLAKCWAQIHGTECESNQAWKELPMLASKHHWSLKYCMALAPKPWKAWPPLGRECRRISRSNILPSPLVLPTLDFAAMQPFVDLPRILSTTSKKSRSSTWQGTASGQVIASRHGSGHTKRP